MSLNVPPKYSDSELDAACQRIVASGIILDQHALRKAGVSGSALRLRAAVDRNSEHVDPDADMSETPDHPNHETYQLRAWSIREAHKWAKRGGRIA